jgi:DNA-binding transcriptional MerR regulator/quercetin dioxygenase-like cupin family protein
MAYTVKEVAAMSGVTVRTLHFYDEAGLLKPAFVGENGYRFYEEPQLLTLQQILFYRELGVELKRIKELLGRAEFEKLGALESHRKVLQEKLIRSQRLIETIDNTIEHLKGTRKMKSNEMFAGFSVAAGEGRFGEGIKLGGRAVDCKVSGRDTAGAMCAFEFTTGWPWHRHHDQDEWVYVVEGDWDLVIDGKHLRIGAGESAFIPRKVVHVCSPVAETGKIVNVYQPAGTMEEFVRAISQLKDLPTREDVANKTYTESQISALHAVFQAHGMDLLGPPADFHFEEANGWQRASSASSATRS